jgi:plasmid stability protein
MTNLTLSLDEELVKRARIRAIGEGTSLSAKVREFLAGYTQTPTAPAATPTTDPANELLALMARVRAEAQPEPTAPTTQRPAPPDQATLREQTYADGFRRLA